MTVSSLAVEPISESPDTSVKELAQTMDDEQIGDVIITEDERPVGIVTDCDIALAYGRGEDLDSMDAQDLMTEDPVTIDEDAEDVELPKLMADEAVRRIPVVNDDGRLVGIATLDDVVAVVGEELDDVADVIEAQSPDYSP